MTATDTPLGDSHNFGRRVTLGATRIHKPRTLFWERLLLSSASPLRRLLDDAAERDGLGRDAFGFLLDLAFADSESPAAGGEVERVQLAPLDARPSATQRDELAQIVGRSIALWSWLGVADLHWENLVLGIGARDRIVFSPLDLEMILDDLASPTATRLLPDPDPEYAAVCRHACGVRRVLPFLGKPVEGVDLVTMAGVYHQTLVFLDRHAGAIGSLLDGLPGLREAPIRVMLRGTGDYVRARTEPPWPPLLDAEAEQLARGDIPYFFRLYGQRGIRYYTDRALTHVATLPTRGNVPRLAPLLPLARGLRSPSRAKLRDEGLFTVLGAFDSTALAGSYKTEHLVASFRARTLVAYLPSGDELQVRRDLREFVGSVYLPCRCGEVRTVFVPATTVCDDAG